MTLSLQVETRNKVNAMANFVKPYLTSLLSKYEGKKIVKFTGYKGFTSQLSKEIAPIHNKLSAEKFRIAFSFSCRMVWAEIDTTYRVTEMGVNYVKNSFVVASFDKDTGIMIPIVSDFKPYRTDYTEQEIIDARKKISDLESEISQIRSQIRDFS